MKILAAVLGVVVLAVVGVGVFATLNLQALIGAHRDQLVARVARVVGRPIGVGAVVMSWWPLGVRLRDVTIGEDPDFGSAPFLVAEGLVMGVHAWPLVHGRIEASGISLDRPRLALIRDGEGRWNVESLGEATVATDQVAATRKSKNRRRSLHVPLEWVLGVALSDVHDGTILIDDRRGKNGAHPSLLLRHVRLRAEDIQLGATARVRVEAAMFANDAPDLQLDLRIADLGQNDAVHSPFTARLEILEADLSVLSEWVRRPGLAAGRVRRIAVDATGTMEGLRGTVELAAADPALRVGRVPLGTLQPLSLQAHLVRDRRTIVIEEMRGVLGTLALVAHGDVTENPGRAALTLGSESMGTLALTVGETAVQVGALEGRVTLDHEGAHLDPLRFQVDGAPFEARGWVTGVDPPALDVRMEGHPFDGTLAADLALDPTGAARARIEATALDLALAVPRFAPDLRDRIAGRGSGAAVMTGRVAGGAMTTGSLGGSGTITVQDGRLRDVNLPDVVVDQIESVPLMPQLVSADTRARYAELFASQDTVVTSASMPFTIGHGRLGTEHVVLDNPAYQIVGKGWIDASQELRFSGTVLLGASVSRTLRDDVRIAKYLAADDGRITLPFVARGRLGHVWVEPDAKRLRSLGLTALLGQSSRESGNGAHDAPHPDHSRARQLEDEMIERLERLIRP